jgi:hypothetical protein
MGHYSGAKKGKRKDEEQTLIQPQKWALDKFVIKETKSIFWYLVNWYRKLRHIN